jgi:hypothetical protein
MRCARCLLCQSGGKTSIARGRFLQVQHEIGAMGLGVGRTELSVIPSISSNVVSPDVSCLVISMHDISVIPEAVELPLLNFLRTNFSTVHIPILRVLLR